MTHTQKNPRILALIGSNQSPSIHRKLVEALAPELKETDIDWLDMMPFDELPLYSRKRQEAGFPEAVLNFYERIALADGVMIASPEHNGSIPAVLKNLIDWISRHDMKFLQNKPTLLLSTSGGPNGGATNLQHMAKLLPFWGADLVGTQSFGNFYERITDNGVSQDTQTQLKALADTLLSAICPKELVGV